MLFKNILIIVLIFFSISDFVSAQQDSVKKDTIAIYKNIESFSKQSRLRTIIYRLIFKPVSTIVKSKSNRSVYKKLIQKPYKTFEKKIIRDIKIVTLDPFGYSVTDTTIATQSFLGKAGNGIHVKTQEIAILNLLLIRKNQPFNSLLVKESERLIRNQKYVHEVSFFVSSPGVKSDSVDILIRVLDTWSIVPRGNISTTKLKIDLTDKNILGTGHTFQNAYARDFRNDIGTFNANYSIPNIRNTYITANMHFGMDGNNYFSRNLTIDRPFFSPFAKWAAGVSLASRFKKDSLEYADTSYIPLNLRFKTQDFWAGKAFRIFKDNDDDELITNLILAARYLRVRYNEKPDVLHDPLSAYSDEDFYLGELGISTRKYVLDKYIFKFGVVEDVPVGKVLGLTAGYQVKPDSKRLYLGIRFSFGNYHQWGYLSPDIRYGTFINDSHAEQGVLFAGINYFSGIFEIGKWKFRQFVKPQLTIGINRFPYDSLTLKEGNGLDGFTSTALSGTNRLLFTLQTQTYAPWNLIGFRFGPYLTYSLGMLGDAKTRFKTSKVYSQLGFGVLIKNENLVFNTFQISISFYPLIPGVGQNIFKTNSFRTTDFGFRDFEIGKPSQAGYR